MGTRLYPLPGGDGDGRKVWYPLGLGMGMGMNFFYGDGYGIVKPVPAPPRPVAIPNSTHVSWPPTLILFPLTLFFFVDQQRFMGLTSFFYLDQCFQLLNLPWELLCFFSEHRCLPLTSVQVREVRVQMFLLCPTCFDFISFLYELYVVFIV